MVGNCLIWWEITQDQRCDIIMPNDIITLVKGYIGATPVEYKQPCAGPRVGKAVKLSFKFSLELKLFLI